METLDKKKKVVAILIILAISLSFIIGGAVLLSNRKKIGSGIDITASRDVTTNTRYRDSVSYSSGFKEYTFIPQSSRSYCFFVSNADIRVYLLGGIQSMSYRSDTEFKGRTYDKCCVITLTARTEYIIRLTKTGNSKDVIYFAIK